MTRSEYLQERRKRKEELIERIRLSYKKHFNPSLRPAIVIKEVTEECNVSKVTYYQAIKEEA